jgi:hypothetical protein
MVIHKHVLRAIPAVLLLGLIAGCPEQTTSVSKNADKKLTLTQPSDYTVVRGGNADVVVKIARTGFRDAVTVTFDNLPAGVEPKDKDNKIATEATSGTFALHANADAPLVTNKEVRVTVAGPDGMRATDTFKLTVKEK